MVWYGYELDKLVKELQFVPYRLKKTATYEVGKKYWCSYWLKWYEVLEVNGRQIKIKWEDGKIVEHSTSLDTLRDYELRPFEFSGDPVNTEESLTAAEIKALCCVGMIDEFVASDLRLLYFENREYRPNDYVFYFVWYERDHRGHMKTHLERDLEKSPRNQKYA